MTTLTYKGFQAAIACDDDAELFHGEVVNLRDVITFQSKSETGLPQAFAESVEDYLAFCNERGEAPAQP